MSGMTDSSTAQGQGTVNVVHLLHTMAYGGVETIIINWLRGIDTRRFRVHVVVFANAGGTERPFIEAAEAAGIEVHRIPWGRHKPVLKATRAFVALLERFDAHVIHAHNTYAHVVALLAGWRTRRPTMSTLYVWSDFGWKRNVLQWVDSRILRFYDLVTAQCEKTLEDSVERGIRRERLRVLISGFEPKPVGLTAGERSQRRRRLGVSGDELVLVNVARMYPEKLQRQLLHWFVTLRDRAPAARLWMLGTGPLEAELKGVCRELGLDDAVRFFGFVTELDETLKLADIQVHPASAEGVPMAICAGMAAGLPVVASAVGGLPEILDHGRCGVLVDPGDEAGFIAQVARLLDDAAERRRLGEAARRFMEEDYSLAVAVDRLERTYVELAQRCDSASS